MKIIFERVGLAGLICIIACLFVSCGKSVEEPGKRIREDQIVAYRDSNKVELFFHLSEKSDPVSIQAEIFRGDGGSPITEEIKVTPGETVTSATTITGEAYRAVLAGIFTGRILVFGDDGTVIERIEPLEVRVYNSVKDPYNSINSFNEPRGEVELDEEEIRPGFYRMRLYRHLYEIDTGIPSLRAEARNLDIKIYTVINGEELQIAEAKDIRPKSLCMNFYVKKEVVDMMDPESELYPALVKCFYTDSGELFETVQAEIELHP